MEIPQQIIDLIFNRNVTKALDLELKVELKKLEKFTIEDILIRENNNKIIKIDSEIRRIHHQTNISASELDVLKICKILNVLNTYLINGISKNDSKSILIFLYANCYFMISPKHFLNQENILKLSKKRISKEIYTLLFKIKFNTSTLTGAPKNELKSLNDYITGISENNIKKVYDFVNAFERGGRGFHINFLLERLCSFLFYLNYNSYIKLVNSLSNTQEFIFYFQSLNENQLIRIANKKSVSNNWANFELIRQIVKREDKDYKFNTRSHQAICNLLIKIKDNDFNFLKETIIYFERSLLFNSALGKFLTIPSSVQLEEVINECLIIDKYSNKSESRKLLLKYFAQNSMDNQFDNLLSIIFKKWDYFFKSLFNDDDFYSNNLVLTDYCEFVVEYFVSMKSEDDVLKQINEQIERIKNIDSIWSKNLSEQTTHYYLYFSKLYLLSYAYKLKKLDKHQILFDFEDLKNDSVKVSRYYKDKTFKTFIGVISSNLDWKNESLNLVET